MDELQSLKSNETFKKFDFKRIAPVTIIEIDTLILYQKQLINNQADFIHLIESYHQHTRFDLGGKLPPKLIEEHALKSAIPFSEFVREYAYNHEIEINFEIISGLLNEYGIS